jgi:hypothetical protein
MNAGGIYGHMVLNKRKVATLRCIKDVAFACNAGGGSLTSYVSDVRLEGDAWCMQHSSLHTYCTQTHGSTNTHLPGLDCCMHGGHLQHKQAREARLHAR